MYPLIAIGRRLSAELGVLFALIITAISLLTFAFIADEVREGSTLGFDEAMLLAFRTPGDTGDPLGPLWLEIAMLDITALGSTTLLVLLTLIVTGYLFIEGKRASALFVLLATSSGAVLNHVLKTLFDRPRPDLVAHLVEVHTLSFPSGHAMGAALTFLTLGVLIVRTEQKRRIKIYVLSIAVALTLMVGISRIYLGVHWPTDVLAGWCVGGAWALMCWLIALWLQRRGAIEPEESRPQT